MTYHAIVALPAGRPAGTVYARGARMLVLGSPLGGGGRLPAASTGHPPWNDFITFQTEFLVGG